ncbi:MAG: ABC transporter ATP-binding protein [Acidobacteriota bacterium]
MGSPQPLQKVLPGLWRILCRFWPHLRKQRLLIGGSTVALFTQIGMRIMEPWPLKFVFDRIIVTKGPRPGHAFANDMDLVWLLAMAALAVVVITGLRALAAYVGTVGFVLAGHRVLAEVRGELFRHLHYLSLSFHTKAKSGDLVVRVIGDVGMLRDAVVTALLPLLTKVLILVSMVGLMFWFSWQLTLVALATVPLLWLRTVHLGRRIQEVAREQRRRRGAMAATATESIGAIRTVQTLSLEDTFGEAFTSQNQKSLKDGVKAKRLAASLERTVAVVVAIASALVLFFGARMVLSATLTPGDLLVFLAYLKSAFRPAQDFAKYTSRLAKASAAGERVLEVLGQAAEVRDLPGAVKAPTFEGVVEFDNVNFAYEPGQPTLKGVQFKVGSGQKVALIGPSGAGKSTLVSLILRLYDPTTGSVKIDGTDLRRYTLESLRSQISTVLQDNLLFATTVRANIGYGAPEATTDQIEAAARLANAHEFIEKLPLGYDTVLGERGVTLSHGQRQRIAIARAAIRRAPILILDEPTSGLDEENVQTVLEALDRLCSSCTTFLITHNLRFAAASDWILYVENGRVVEWGTHAELMRTGGRYAVLFGRQVATIASHTARGGTHAAMP